MDVESEIYFIDVAGQYDKILAEAPVAGGAAAPADGAANKVPDEVLRHDYGVTHDHSGGFFFIKSLKAGVIDTKQHEVFGAGAHVVSLKWKLSKGGFCTISTTAAGDGAPPKICPSEPGATMWFPDKDYSGCVVGLSPDGQYTVTKCESNGNCELSHAASPDDNKPDPMDVVGSTGLQTESTITDVLQEKNTADIILSPAEARYYLRLRCTLKGDETKVIEQALEIDPNPGSDGCDSGTLESMGKCAAPKFIKFVSVPGAAALVPAGFTPNGGGDGGKIPHQLTPEEVAAKAQQNAAQAKREAELEMAQAQADESQAEKEEADVDAQEASGEARGDEARGGEGRAEDERCPVHALEDVDDSLDEATVKQEMEALKLSDLEMDILSSPQHGHASAWEDCSWPQRLAMAKQFKLAVVENGVRKRRRRR